MRSWIYVTRGRFARQARLGLGDSQEERLSRAGFAGPVAMVYLSASLRGRKKKAHPNSYRA
jgi:hypothetical protein